VFGATVTLYDEEDDSTVTYQIVGDDEADIKENKISISSPIARALIGKNEGDMVQFRAPKGLVSFEIESVEYI
jgi:transcription elongation factor GreA